MFIFNICKDMGNKSFEYQIFESPLWLITGVGGSFFALSPIYTPIINKSVPNWMRDAFMISLPSMEDNSILKHLNILHTITKLVKKNLATNWNKNKNKNWM